MKKYRIFAAACMVVELVAILIVNIVLVGYYKEDRNRLYRVEANRVAGYIRENGSLAGLDLGTYESIVDVRVFDPQGVCNKDYVVEEVDGTLYQIVYEFSNRKKITTIVNLSLALFCVMTFAILVTVGRRVIRPFSGMEELPYEIAKGNLSTPLKADKNRFFGKMIWGMDMLRETLEDRKERELHLQKEKKTLILSLSHDIKTPLSAIKLYTRALQEGIYESEEEQKEAFLGILKNADEMETYVNQIVEASREDFLNLDTKEGEFYLSEALQAVRVYYTEKLALLHTRFEMGEWQECLIKGDRDRVVEVFQNIMENAIKYGDGRCISISFSEEEDCCLASVSNTGEGITEAELVHVFDSFYRGSNAGKEKGSGLGLYICRNLMRKMDGEVFAEQKEGCFITTVVLRKA